MEPRELVKDVLSVLFQFGMLCVAITALTTWQRQLRGTATHATALKLATDAKALNYVFFESRSPLYRAWEFPPAYYETINDRRSTSEEADAWRHVYQNRWKQLWPKIRRIAHTRARVGAVLGDQVAEASEKLARVAMQLRDWMDHSIEQKRAGPEIVSRWTDQKFVKRVNQSIAMELGEPTDAYSLEFIAARDTLLRLVKPYLS